MMNRDKVLQGSWFLKTINGNKLSYLLIELTREHGEIRIAPNTVGNLMVYSQDFGGREDCVIGYIDLAEEIFKVL